MIQRVRLSKTAPRSTFRRQQERDFWTLVQIAMYCALGIALAITLLGILPLLPTLLWRPE